MEHMVVRQTVRVAGFRQLFMKGALVPADAAVVTERPDLFATPEEYAQKEARPQSTEELGDRAMSTRVRRGAAVPPSSPDAAAARRAAEQQANELDDAPLLYPCPKADAAGCTATFGSESGAKIHAVRAHR